MTDTRERTQQQEAERTRADLVQFVERMERLRGLDARAENAYDEMRQEIEDRPLCAEIVIQVNVTLGTGGPASGVMFDTERTSYGLEMVSARVWHQDWYTSKGYAELDDDVAEHLWSLWGCEMLMEGDQ